MKRGYIFEREGLMNGFKKCYGNRVFHTTPLHLTTKTEKEINEIAKHIKYFHTEKVDYSSRGKQEGLFRELIALPIFLTTYMYTGL